MPSLVFKSFFKAGWFLESAFSEDGAVDFLFFKQHDAKNFRDNYFRIPRT